ncbi:MAG: carbon storage regulator [Chloroflexota bacterium]|jgi:carbon storage regulator|nr:carbon storage regulator [Chloroflexota bacterium]
MLILSRRVGEGIIVGHDVELVVLGVDGAHVRIGVRAPQNVRILRKELLEQVQAENRRAIGSWDGALLGALSPEVAPA